MIALWERGDSVTRYARNGMVVLILTSFPRQHQTHSPVPIARAAGRRTAAASPQIASCCADLSGVIEISPLRGELFSRNLLKNGARIPLLF